MSSNQKKINEGSDAKNSVSPKSSISKQKNSEKSKDTGNKINNDLKVLSDHIALQSKRSSLANGNLENIFNNIFTKDQEIQNLNNKESIIHHLDFLGQEQPVKKAKQKTPLTYKRSQSVYISPIRISDGMNKIGSEYSLTPNRKSFGNEKNTSLSNNKMNKGSMPVFSLAGALKENENFSSGNQNSNSKNNTEFNKKVFKIGISNSMRIKRSKVRSLENNPRKMRIYEKGLFHMQKKELEIDMMRNKLNKASTSKLKDKPEMNKNSQKIMQTKFSDKKPIFKRAEEIIESKNNTILKLKKYHNEDTNSKWGDFSLNHDKSQIENLTHLDNFEYSHFSKNPLGNSGKNTSSNFNNKFFNFTKTPNSGNRTLLKMINDTNNDLGNISAINSLHQNSENKNKKNDEYSHSGYLNFMNKNQNKKKQNEEDNKFKNFEHEEFIPFNIQYQQRTMEWIKNKEMWEQKKKEKIEMNKKIAENDDLPENKGFYFKPKVNKNSEKIISSKRALSQSTLSIINNNKENNNFDHLLEDNLSNFNNSIFSKSGVKVKTPKKNKYSVYENLYSKRFDIEKKREKIMEETMYDFTPKINQAIFYNKNQELTKKKNKIPNPKKNGLDKDKKIAESAATLKKFSPDKIVMKKLNRVKEIKEIEQEEKNKKKKKEQELFDLFDKVDKENKINENKLKNNGRASVDIGQLYKINIRSASAWDLNKENNAYSNNKFAKIVSKVGTIKF